MTGIAAGISGILKHLAKKAIGPSSSMNARCLLRTSSPPSWTLWRASNGSFSSATRGNFRRSVRAGLSGYLPRPGARHFPLSFHVLRAAMRS